MARSDAAVVRWPSTQRSLFQWILVEDSSHFLHGRKTTVLGSTVDGNLMCDNAGCLSSWSARSVECACCQQERRARSRVIQGEDDPRLREKRFLEAPAIFQNNDIKCEVNKIRAQIFAAETQQALTWSIAKDKPGNRVLGEKMNIVDGTRRKCGWAGMTAIVQACMARCI